MTASLAAPRVRLGVSALALVLAALGFDEPRAGERTSREIIVKNGEDLERLIARLAEQWATELEPRPPAPIPDDPPPHEGALIDIPYIIEPPDFLLVEVLEALPGRPITGEHLVRPDGTITLGWYGDVHVRGLTLEQAKAKIILHLRKYIKDDVLGRVLEEIEPTDLDPVPGREEFPPLPSRAPDMEDSPRGPDDQIPPLPPDRFPHTPEATEPSPEAAHSSGRSTSQPKRRPRFAEPVPKRSRPSAHRRVPTPPTTSHHQTIRRIAQNSPETPPSSDEYRRQLEERLRAFRAQRQAQRQPSPPTTAPILIPAAPNQSVKITIEVNGLQVPQAFLEAQPPHVSTPAPDTMREKGPDEEKGPSEEPMPGEPVPPAEMAQESYRTKVKFVNPADSDRVFVDISAYNSKYYYVIGDVGTPGKFPTTGQDTVLDALQYAAGFIPTTDPKDIKLVRPARGDQPAKVYPIDWEAIYEHGDARANLQVFPGDRIVVGRNAVVKRTVELSRLAEPFSVVWNQILTSSSVMKNLAAIEGLTPPTSSNVHVRVGPWTFSVTRDSDLTALTPEQREALLKSWAEFWWKNTDPAQGAQLDEQIFRDGIIRHASPPAQPKPNPKPGDQDKDW